MLSRHKTLLKASELLSLFSALGAFAIAALVRFNSRAELPFELVLVGAWALLFLTFGVACYLGSEYAKCVRDPGSLWGEDGLSVKELAAIVQWSPKAYKVAAFAGMLVGIGTALAVGSIHWSSSAPPTSREVVGTMLYMSCFFLLALPVLASAARMPGTYAERFGNLSNTSDA